jgi:rhodanese-related sulfurtransferase
MMAKETVYLVNVHVPYEGEIAGTDAFIPYTEIVSRLDELPFGKQQVVIYCRSGNMSTEAAQAMVDAGAPPFSELGGGFYAWQDAGYPLQTNPT